MLVRVRTSFRAPDFSRGPFHNPGSFTTKHQQLDRNDKGQLGDATLPSSATPVKVPGLEDIVQIGGRDAYTVALDRAGRVFWWGEVGAAWKEGPPSDVVRVEGLGPP